MTKTFERKDTGAYVQVFPRDGVHLLAVELFDCNQLSLDAAKARRDMLDDAIRYAEERNKP